MKHPENRHIPPLVLFYTKFVCKQKQQRVIDDRNYYQIQWQTFLLHSKQQPRSWLIAIALIGPDKHYLCAAPLPSSTQALLLFNAQFPPL
jgi:hypothetical protein